LCNIIACYAVTPTIRRYFITEASAEASCGERCEPPDADVSLDGQIYYNHDARSWCFEKLAELTGCVDRDSRYFELESWKFLFAGALQSRYSEVPTDQLLRGTVHYCHRCDVRGFGYETKPMLVVATDAPVYKLASSY
jgi:hypothetical protein